MKQHKICYAQPCASGPVCFHSPLFRYNIRTLGMKIKIIKKPCIILKDHKSEQSEICHFFIVRFLSTHANLIYFYSYVIGIYNVFYKHLRIPFLQPMPFDLTDQIYPRFNCEIQSLQSSLRACALLWWQEKLFAMKGFVMLLFECFCSESILFVLNRKAHEHGVHLIVSGGRRVLFIVTARSHKLNKKIFFCTLFSYFVFFLYLQNGHRTTIENLSNIK